jgi:hypothetical protein
MVEANISNQCYIQSFMIRNRVLEETHARKTDWI